MDFTALDLWACISIYLGFGLIRASLPPPRMSSNDVNPSKSLGIAGYCLFLTGIFVLGIELFRHFR